MAEHACYVELPYAPQPRTSPFVLHISGTLLMGGSGPIQKRYSSLRKVLLTDSLKFSAVRLPKTSFTPSLMGWTTKWQIRLHRAMLRDVLGVEPVGFGMQNEVWDPALTDLIAVNRYTYSFIETLSLRKVGWSFLSCGDCIKRIGPQSVLGCR